MNIQQGDFVLCKNWWWPPAGANIPPRLRARVGRVRDIVTIQAVRMDGVQVTELVELEDGLLEVAKNCTVLIRFGGAAHG